MDSPGNETLIQKLEKHKSNQKMIYISSQYPMNAEGYTNIEQIGEGMNSNKVFSAQCKEWGKELVAIKQVDLSQQTEEIKERFANEVLVMSVGTLCEFLVKFHCSFVFEDVLWIVMDLCEGSLRDVLKWKYPKGFDDESVICSIMNQTLKGLCYLHEQNIIHRDIKAGNILFNKEGHIKLADFGVTAVLAHNKERRSTMAGTWQWMAPEVVNLCESGYEFKVDIWSLGITAIELAYGMVPYGDAKPYHVAIYIIQNSPPTLDNPRCPNTQPKYHFSPEFKNFTDKCLRTQSSKRPTAAKLLNQNFFKNLPDPTHLKSALLEGLPPQEERFRHKKTPKKSKDSPHPMLKPPADSNKQTTKRAQSVKETKPPSLSPRSGGTMREGRSGRGLGEQLPRDKRKSESPGKDDCSPQDKRGHSRSPRGDRDCPSRQRKSHSPQGPSPRGSPRGHSPSPKRDKDCPSRQRKSHSPQGPSPRGSPRGHSPSPRRDKDCPSRQRKSHSPQSPSPRGTGDGLLPRALGNSHGTRLGDSLTPRGMGDSPHCRKSHSSRGMGDSHGRLGDSHTPQGMGDSHGPRVTSDIRNSRGNKESHPKKDPHEQIAKQNKEGHRKKKSIGKVKGEEEGYTPRKIKEEDEGYTPRKIKEEEEGYAHRKIKSIGKVKEEEEGYTPRKIKEEDEGFTPRKIKDEEEGYAHRKIKEGERQIPRKIKSTEKAKEEF